MSRYDTDRVRKAFKKACEIPGQETDLRKARERALETSEQTLSRQETHRVRKATDRACKTRKRASKIPEQVLQKEKNDKDRESSKRRKNMSIEHAISNHKDGADLVDAMPDGCRGFCN